jgi:hypothetical protein
MSKKKKKKRSQEPLGNYHPPGAKAAAKEKKGLTLFEILIIGFLLSYVAAWIVTWQLDVPVHSWVTLFTYLVFGAILLVKPSIFIDFMAKRNKSLRTDLPKIAKFTRRVRIVGVVLLALGVALVLSMMNSVINPPGAYDNTDDTVYEVTGDTETGDTETGDTEAGDTEAGDTETGDTETGDTGDTD